MNNDSKNRVIAGAKKSGELAKERGLKVQKKYYENPKQCRECNNILTYEKRVNTFCNLTCKSIYYGREKKKANRKFKEENNLIKICNSCNSELLSSKRKFCSQQCQQNYRYNNYIKKWLDGEESGGQPKKNILALPVKRYLRETRGEKCEECGWNKKNPVTNKVPLEVHHIKENTNHRPENLKLLCPNCHSLTENYRNLNSGNGREYRRKDAIEKRKEDQLKLNQENNKIKPEIIKPKKLTKEELLVQRPSYNELKENIIKEGYAATGRKYGKADNTIRKWIKDWQEYLGIKEEIKLDYTQYNHP